MSSRLRSGDPFAHPAMEHASTGMKMAAGESAVHRGHILLNQSETSQEGLVWKDLTGAESVKQRRSLAVQKY